MSKKSEMSELKINPTVNHSTHLIQKRLTERNDFKSSFKCHKSVVFVNPKKLSSNQLKDVSKVIPNVGNSNQEVMRNNLVKVYINPNFKKTHLPTEQQTLSTNKLCSTQREYTSNSICRKYCQDTTSISAKELKSVKSQLNQNLNSPKDEQTCSGLNKNCKIFINPNYTSGDLKIKSESAQNSKAINVRYERENLHTRHLEPGLNSTTITSGVVSKIEVLHLDPKKHSGKKSTCLSKMKTLKRLPLEGKHERKKEKSSNTIFLNPKFENRLKENGMFSNDQNKLHSSSVSRNIPVHTTQRSFKSDQTEQTSSNQTSTSSTLLCVSNRCLTTVQQVSTKKLVSPRKRSCSTSLVALSATKLIRKKKPSQQVETNVKHSLNRPVFLSKTKFVRSPPSKCVKNKLTEKAKVKRVLPKACLKLLTPDRINKLRKQSFTESVTNLVNVVPNCTSVTKIRSKNGKSLRLVRKKDEVNKSITKPSNKKSLNTSQTQKSTLKNQIKKDALCIVKKLKSRFSKINVEQIKNRSSCHPNVSKYVYKSREFITKQNKRKSVCNTKRLCPNKSKVTNYLCEKYKYRFIRKQSRISTNKFERSRKVFKNTTQNSVIPSKTTKKWKLQNSGSKLNHIRKKYSLVNISGIFYRCSRTSLTRNKTSPSKVSQVGQKQSSGLLLNISGKKFQLENNGQTLRCLGSAPGRKRVDIGGVTFISTTSGSSLIRTNYHTARSIITQAKQKSLSQLTRKHKKSNEPCPFYHRLGRCFGKERGFCIRLHDPKYIAVCKKYILGACEDSHCLLSHNITCHNMPTCQHFLAGHCGRDHCLYPHIKVSDNAPICLDFLRGFCAQGDQCTKRHLQICPSFEKGMCPRGKYCPYPHPKSKSHLPLKGKFKHLETRIRPSMDHEMVVSSCSIRYFEDVNLQKEKNIEPSEDVEDPEACAEEREEIGSRLKNRPKLGRLPSFIPLTLDGSCNDSTLEETKL